MSKATSNFIYKIYNLVKNNRPDLLDWDTQNTGFIITNLKLFIDSVLPKQFGIKKLDSFVRKFNRHGFKRLKIGENKMRFVHKYFDRQGKFLSKIRRLSKEQFIPKHIKLRQIREQMQKDNPEKISISKRQNKDQFQQESQNQDEKLSQQQCGKIQDHSTQNKSNIKSQFIYQNYLPFVDHHNFAQMIQFGYPSMMEWANPIIKQQVEQTKNEIQGNQYQIFYAKLVIKQNDV